MTDTHDTNLPEKQVELEEEKKTVEVSETATAETPAEEQAMESTVETAPAQKLTKEEVIARLKDIAGDVESVTKAEIDGLKQTFYKLHNAEQEAARKKFAEAGGAPEDYVPTPDPLEEEMKNAMSVIKNKRNELAAEVEKLTPITSEEYNESEEGIGYLAKKYHFPNGKVVMPAEAMEDITDLLN